MGRVTGVLGGAMAAACLALGAGVATAQTNPVYVPLGQVKGALYRPDSGPAPHVAVFRMHRTANSLSNNVCTELSKRGFLVLCANTRYENNEAQVNFEAMAQDTRAGVEFLRRQPGVTKVLLFGHSGGGPLMSFYEAVAENGVAFCQDPHKLTRCEDNLAGLPKADGMILADAHPGNPTMIMRGLNPSVMDDTNPPTGRIDHSLDPFDPRNGYNPTGPSHYSLDFQKRYFAGQAARMQRLIKSALDKREAMKAGKYPYSDDDIFLIPGGGAPGAGGAGGATLYDLDPTVEAVNATKRPEKLLKNDGSISVQVVHSVAVAEPGLIERQNRSFAQGTKIFTVRSFLSSNAVRATDIVENVDDCSTNNSTLCAVPKIHVPILVMGMGGFHLVRDAEHIAEVSGSADKDMLIVEGAVHGFTPCTACEKTPGQYANATRNMFDYIAKWINARY